MQHTNDDSSLFTQVNEMQYIQNKIEKEFGFMWEMIFNPDITKQAIKFSVRKYKSDQPELIIDDVPVVRERSFKHLGVYRDERLSILSAFVKFSLMQERGYLL